MRSLIVFITPIVLFAHSLSVTASYEEGELFIESFFGNGSACKDCEFTIAKNEKEVFKGKLGVEGDFEEAVNVKPPFDIHIDGGMGHWADVKIDGTEMGEQADIQESSNATMNSIDETKIRQIIRSELNKQNGKIEAMVSKNKSTLEKMLVGLGYILGVFGLWQLFAKRREK